MSSPECEPYNHSVNYYDKFWKRFLLNEIGKQNLTQVREKLDIFTRRLAKIDDLFKEWQTLLEPITKGRRRARKPEEGEKEICS
jgi:DNA-binding PadR family transcriptional regulator